MDDMGTTQKLEFSIPHILMSNIAKRYSFNSTILTKKTSFTK